MAYTTIDDPEQFMQVKTFSGNGSDDHAITLDATSDMQPDFVWIKNCEEESSDDPHAFFDSVRGATKYIVSNTTAGELTDADTLDAFQSDGFRVDDDTKVNTNAEDYVAFCWKMGTTSGISGGSITPAGYSINTTAKQGIYKWAGTGSAGNIAHGLSAVPHFMIVKNLRATAGWQVYHKALGGTKVIFLNATAAPDTVDEAWDDTNPTSTLFSLHNEAATNGSGANYIGYVFSSVRGYSKFIHYTGNSSTDGQTVWCGFKPSFVLVKKTSGSAAWYLWNNKRDGYNGPSGMASLFPYHLSQEDLGATLRINFLSSGFKFLTTDGDHNGSGGDYILMAFAEAPFVNSKGVPCNAR